MGLSVEDWAEIRRLHRAERMPIKVIARVLGCPKEHGEGGTGRRWSAGVSTPANRVGDSLGMSGEFIRWKDLMARPSSYPAELRQRAVGMVFESKAGYPSEFAAIDAVARKLGSGRRKGCRSLGSSRYVRCSPSTAARSPRPPSTPPCSSTRSFRRLTRRAV
jgi:hypothetical protein